MPPSTGITVPVTYAARSEARNAATARDLGGRAEAPCRDLLEVAAGRSVGAVDRAQAVGVDPSRRDRVDGDPVRAELAGEGLQPADDARPHGVRERQVGERLAHRGRLDRDDPAAAALAQVREAAPDERHVGGEEQRDRLLDGLGGQSTAACRAAGRRRSGRGRRCRRTRPRSPGRVARGAEGW